jgi:hypothetical protein
LNLEAISEVFFLNFLSQRGPIPAYLSSVAFSIASYFTSLQASHHCLRPQPHSHSTLSPTSFPSPIMHLPLLKFLTNFCFFFQSQNYVIYFVNQQIIVRVLIKLRIGFLIKLFIVRVLNQQIPLLFFFSAKSHINRVFYIYIKLNLN